MDTKEFNIYQTFVRVRNFGVANSASFSPNTVAAELFAGITSIINELTGHVTSQTSGDNTRRQGTSTKAILRNELREDLITISRTARTMVSILPGLEDKFRLPRKISDKQLLSSARAFAVDATPFVAEFVKCALPENFLEELNNNIKLFEKAVDEQYLGSETRVTASAAIDDSIDRGMDTVRQLDVIVKNRFSNDPAKLAAWASAKHVERSPRPAPETETPQPNAIS
jgi:hypothetical protein